MMKKRLILAFTFATAFLIAGAQQLPLYTQIYNNDFLYNPSFTMMEDYSSVTAFYRKQWVNIGGGGPTTRGVVFQTPLKNEKIGLGLNLINDVNGVFARTGGYATYAYDLRLSSDHHLLMGLTAGYLQTTIDFDASDGDPIILAQQGNTPNALDATFGLGYKWNHLKVGLAVPHLFDELFNPLISNSDTTQIYFHRRHFLGSAAYGFKLGTNFELKPTVLVRYTPNAEGMLIEGNLLFTIRDKVWLAANYRNGTFIGVGAGAIMSNRLNIGYSYDFTIGDFGPFGGATHELTLGLKLAKSKDDFEEGRGVEPLIIKENPWDADIKKLRQQLLELEEKAKLQGDSLGDHEKRIKLLEEQKDSLNALIKEEIKKELDNMPVGNASYDVRDPNAYNPNGGTNYGGLDGGNGNPGQTGNQGNTGNPGQTGNQGNTGAPGGSNYTMFQNPMVTDDPEAPYGRKEDGTPIGKNERYTGKVYKDKNGQTPLTESNKTKNFYNDRGERIPDISKYSGPVYNAENQLVDYVRNGGDDPSQYREFSRQELVNDGISYMAPGNYVVVGSFRSKENAQALLKDLQANGVDDAGIVYNNMRRWFYVYTIKTDDFDKSINQARNHRATDFKDAWIHVILSK